jgi:prepilin-type N-terminal cleavage/methylation domain-containing protein
MLHRNAASEADGFSLIEVLIAVAIMGIAVVAVLGAIGTQIKGVAVHRSQSNAAAVLGSAVELLKGNVAYKDCAAVSPPNAGYSAYLNAAQTAVVPADWASQGWTAAKAVTITAISYWNGTSFPDPASAGYAASNTCHDSDSTDTYGVLRMQSIRVVVTDPRGDDVETIDVVKRG